MFFFFYGRKTSEVTVDDGTNRYWLNHIIPGLKIKQKEISLFLSTYFDYGERSIFYIVFCLVLVLLLIKKNKDNKYV